jgi:exosortase E/protease (VPEID-CTERM system)
VPYRYNRRVNQQVSNPRAAFPRFQLGLAARLAILGAVFLAEKVVLNVFVDYAGAQSAQGLGVVLRIAQHLGFRFLVAFAMALALFAYIRRGPSLAAAAAALRREPVRPGWILSHLLLVGALAALTHLLYRHTASSVSLAAVAALWLIVGAVAFLAALLAMAPWPAWRACARALGPSWWFAAMAALIGTAATQVTQGLWAPSAGLTFRLVRGLLTPFIPTLSADPAAMILSTDRFAVQVADVCSGLEGMGLMLAFSAAWLLCFRKEYIFPRALLLIAGGVAASFVFNVLRIAALFGIGDAGFPDVAVYGFHSQAGWIAFNIVACGWVYFSRRSRWLNRAAHRPKVAEATDNPTAAYLMPLLSVLAAGAVSHALSGRFEYLYPLRLIACLVALVHYRRRFTALDWHWSWRAPILGGGVFVVWVAAAHFLLPAAGEPPALTALPPVLRGLWIASRFAASILTVPIAEELAYRGYLMRRLSSSEFESVPFRSVRWSALGLSAVVFGLGHGALWLPGIAAGVAFGLIAVRSGKLGEAVVAHATANGLVGATVLVGNQWQLW